MGNIPTHNPQTGELNPYYEELTGERNPLLPEEKIVIPTFDMRGLVGKNFKFKGQYGLSTWTDKVKAIRSHNSVEFDVPLDLKVPKEGEPFKADKFKIIGIPKQYEENGFFQVTSVKHTIDGMIWKTEVEGGLRLNR